MSKSELWWASIGGNACEPIRVTRDERGAPKEWFSIGCADPHPSWDGMQLVKQIYGSDIPITPDEAKARRKEWERLHPGRQPTGYRRFD